MNILNIEIYSTTILFILVIDYLSKFRKYITKSSYIWFILVISILINSINTFIYIINLSYMKDITYIIYIAINFISSLSVHIYVFHNYIKEDIEIKKTIRKGAYSILLFTILLIIYIVLKNNSIINIPVNMVTIINTLPIIISIYLYIYNYKKHNKNIDYKLLLGLFIVIIGTLLMIFYNYPCFMNVAYTLFALIVYIQKHDIIMNTDPLTGLYNKKVLESFIINIKPNSKLAIFNIDADKFKDINDTYGHSKGDEILINIAEILRKSTRKSDYIFRNGGDEFIIIANVKRDDEENIILKRIENNVKAHNKKSEVKISLSIGHDVITTDKNTTPEEFIIFLETIDEKMYTEKHKIKIS